MVGPVIADFGSQEQKERFLPPTANLDIWWCQGFSEPDAGSDLASLRTTAVRDGDDYVVNGQKTWTTLGQYADWIFCLVRTDPDAEQAAGGISFLLFPMDTPGRHAAPDRADRRRLRGQRGVLRGRPRARPSNLVGEENQGWSYAKFLLGNERVGVARVGATKRALAAGQEARQTPTDGGRCSTTRCSPPQSPSSRTSCSPSSSPRCGWSRTPPTASRTRPRRCSSSRAPSCSRPSPSCSSTSPARSRSPPAPGGGDGSDIPEWARVAAPTYLNYRKVSIYGGSNEIQRKIIAGTILGL